MPGAGKESRTPRSSAWKAAGRPLSLFTRIDLPLDAGARPDDSARGPPHRLEFWWMVMDLNHRGPFRCRPGYSRVQSAALPTIRYWYTVWVSIPSRQFEGLVATPAASRCSKVFHTAAACDLQANAPNPSVVGLRWSIRSGSPASGMRMERKASLELAASTLARLRSTAELLPQELDDGAWAPPDRGSATPGVAIEKTTHPNC